MPTLDASRVSQRDEPVVCVLLAGCGAPARANSVSIPAVRHRRDAIRIRKLKKAKRREFFIFIAGVSGDEAHAGYLPDVRLRMCYIVFKRSITYIFFRPGPSILLFATKPTWGLRTGAYVAPVLERERNVISADSIRRPYRPVTVQRIPLSAVQFTLVTWPATTSASKRQRPIRAAAPSFTMT